MKEHTSIMRGLDLQPSWFGGSGGYSAYNTTQLGAYKDGNICNNGHFLLFVHSLLNMSIVRAQQSRVIHEAEQ